MEIRYDVDDLGKQQTVVRSLVQRETGVKEYIWAQEVNNQRQEITV